MKLCRGSIDQTLILERQATHQELLALNAVLIQVCTRGHQLRQLVNARRTVRHSIARSADHSTKAPEVLEHPSEN
jgi:hypothetical protein